MAHFAQLDANNVVMQVIVISNDAVQNLPFPESESIGVAFCQSLYGADTVWKQTSYNNNFRLCYAGIGYTFEVKLIDGEEVEGFSPPVEEVDVLGKEY